VSAGGRRCGWVDTTKADYVAYHDREWGVPVRDDRLLFELLILEGAQAGLSWYTVLRKRAAYRRAFARFDPEQVARFDEQRIAGLLADPGIVRHRQKIAAAVGNARCFLEVQAEHGSFAAYVWAFVGGRPILNRPRTPADCPARSAESEALSRDLGRRGFRFVGPTIMYAFMQAAGLVNDHLIGCFRRRQIIDAGC